jgi:hypothetical protein
MYENGKEICIDTDDQCTRCIYRFDQEQMCPFLEALSLGFVFLREEIAVKNCGFFKKRGSHLKVVQDA